MDDIIEFANENLEVELDSDILNYIPDQNRAFSVSSIRGWEVTGISHLLNSSSEPAAEKMNSESEHREEDFPSSSSSLSHVLSSSDDSVAPSGNGNRLSRRKRSRTDPLNKKPRIDYKNPFHADRLTKAISAVITALRGDPLGFHKNITTIAKTHDIPYNTLRDNVLRYFLHFLYLHLHIQRYLIYGLLSCYQFSYLIQLLIAEVSV